MCLQTRAFKNENTTKKYQKMVAQDLSIYGMMFRKRSHVSTKFTQMTYVKSSDLIKPPEEFFQKHLQQIPPSLRLAVIKMQVIELYQPISAEAVECRSARRCHEGRWHWGRGCRSSCRRRRTFHRPRRSRPMCAHSAPKGAVPLGDSWLQRLAWRKWPKQRIDLKWLRKIQSQFWLYKKQLSTCPKCFSYLGTAPSSLRWAEIHLAMKPSRGKLALLPCPRISQAVLRV